MLCLDNDILRKARRDPPDPKVINYLATREDEAWCISTIVLFEYLQHYETNTEVRQQQRELNQLIDETIKLNPAIVVEAVELKNSLAQVGTSLDFADLLIAATARHVDATLVTANKNDFDKPPIHDLLDIEIVETS